MSPLWTLLGVAAQLLFASRTFIQWFLSEREKKVASPLVYWIISLAASQCMFVYGCARSDLAIIVGESIIYPVYLYNLYLKGLDFKKWWCWGLCMIVPLCTAVYVALNFQSVASHLVFASSIPAWMVLYGICGQLLFKFRFIYQFAFASISGRSEFPLGFWIISLLGTLIIVTYGALRGDFVLLLQAFNLVAVVRNIMLLRREAK